MRNHALRLKRVVLFLSVPTAAHSVARLTAKCVKEYGMAMHKPRKQMRFQNGGDVNEAEMKQRGLDISNRAREEGTEKTSFFQNQRGLQKK
jgi:hypothetical protein